MSLGHRTTRAAGYLGLAALAVALAAVATWRLVRPERPNLANPGTWMLIKATTMPGGEEVHVYAYRHDSSDWDPYDVRQNKVVIGPGSAESTRQFMWPADDGYAAGWCEIVDAGGGSVVVVLFEQEDVVRVLQYGQGRFTFRPEHDELITTCPLRMGAEGATGEITFACPKDGGPRTWRWSVSRGFVEDSSGS